MKSSTKPLPRDGFPAPKSGWSGTGWRAAQIVTLAATVALIAGLVVWPATALRVLWNLLIPILPITFLLAPHLWRGICPLATLNQCTSGALGHRKLRGRHLMAANVLGIVLLAVLVPARRFLFNENGPALAATIVAVALAALVLGALFDGRAGFCNAVCPVLPVERLYGQHPLWKLDHHRCDGCTLCIPKGCLDLAPAKSILAATGPETGGNHWLTTAYGIFAAAMPGFIIGYFTTSNVSWTEAPRVYLWVALCSAGSYLVAALAVRFLGLTRPVSLALLAAVAVALYYWWAAPLITDALSLPTVCALVARGALLLLVALWLMRTWPRLQANRSQAPGRTTPACGPQATPCEGPTLPDEQTRVP
ncbi:MAG: hypothetical protein KA004_09095 [Verrucomicrobiales bacterium]|nr:hypothetical protein [Verrucomicrobiales bacterium]